MADLHGIAAHHLDKKCSLAEFAEWESNATVFICERTNSGNIFAISGCLSTRSYGMREGQLFDFSHQCSDRDRIIFGKILEIVNIVDGEIEGEFAPSKVIPWYVLK